jgi:hypothetical protein
MGTEGLLVSRGELARVIAVVLGVMPSACGGGGGASDGDAGGGNDSGPAAGEDGGGPGGDESDLVFAPDVLHQVTIEVAEEDVSSLDQVSEERVPCRLTYDGVTLEEVGVRNRGQTSFRPSSGKLGFNLKMNEYVAGQRLHGLKKLVLGNTVQDESFSIEALTYLVYQRAGLPAPRIAQAIVTFNGEVKGIYTVVEVVNDQFLARHYGAGMGDGNLYEGPWDFPQGAGAADLKDEEEEMRSRDDLVALTAAVMDSEDGDLVAALDPLLDVDQFIRTAAIDMVTCAWDGYTIAAWNFYLYHLPGRDEFVFLPHGANWPYWVAELDPYDVDFRPWSPDDPAGYLARRMVAVPEMDQRFRDAIADVAGTPFDAAALLERIDLIETVLATADDSAPAVRADLETFAGGAETARAWVSDRDAFLDAL